MITLRALTKRYGDKTVVDELSTEIVPGAVTGFLGPNGAGKSTTMRMVLGLDHPTSGSALIRGRPYAALRHPLREVGALLLLLVMPMLLAAIGLRAAGDYLPGLAGLNLMFGQDGHNPVTGMPSPYPQVVALVLLTGWALLALGVGAVLLRERDA